MRLPSKAISLAAVLVGMLVSSPVSAQISPYVYVQMSLGVPWFLYFVFLACILLPFIVLIAIAWRRYYVAGKEGGESKRRLEDL